MIPGNYLIAILVSMVGSLLTVLGSHLAKTALMDPEAGKRWRKVGDVVLSPRWMCGFLFGSLTVPGYLLAVSLAPISLVAPLSGLTVVLNLMSAPMFVGEKWQPWPDFVGTPLIVIGTVATTLSTPVAESGQIDYEKFRELFVDRTTLICLAIVVPSMMSLAAYTNEHRERFEKVAAQRPTNPPISHVTLPALAAALAAALVAVATKVFTKFLQAGVPYYITGAIFICGVPLILTQINMFSRGQKMYPQILFYPVFAALSVVLNTLVGTIFFQEYAGFFEDSKTLAIFMCGMCAIVCGTLLFGFRKNSQVAEPDQQGHEMRSNANDAFIPVPC